MAKRTLAQKQATFKKNVRMSRDKIKKKTKAWSQKQRRQLP